MQKHDDYIKQLGRNARAKNLPLTANPFIDGSNDGDLWAEGWLEGPAKTQEKPNKKVN